MKIGIKVGDVMTRNFISARPDIPLLTAVRLMVKKKVGSLILMKESSLKGILTEKDIMWAISKKQDLRKVNAIDICTRKITTIKPSADIYDAIVLMKKKKFRRLPVVVKKKVIGYLTLKEILKIQPELFEIARQGYNMDIDRDLKEKGSEIITEGVCEECSKIDFLFLENERLICDSCKCEKTMI
jgi:CBS domain-containing protein